MPIIETLLQRNWTFFRRLQHGWYRVDGTERADAGSPQVISAAKQSRFPRRMLLTGLAWAGWAAVLIALMLIGRMNLHRLTQPPAYPTCGGSCARPSSTALIELKRPAIASATISSFSPSITDNAIRCRIASRNSVTGCLTGDVTAFPAVPSGVGFRGAGRDAV